MTPHRHPAVVVSARRLARRPARAALMLALPLLLVASRVAGAAFQDNFAARETIDTQSGLLAGDNLTATREDDEPRHADRRGGASVWISWIAPTNGVVTFSTAGSSFDTLLAAYVRESADPGEPDDLEEVGANDDDETLPVATSRMVFGARAGERYELAIDGYLGGRGTIELTWSMQTTVDPPPIILSTPGDQALLEGTPFTLTVQVDNPSAYDLHWFFNDEELEAEEGSGLVIPALTSEHVGTYRLRLRLGELRFFSQPIVIQINSEGLTNSLVRDKLLDTVAGPGANGLAAPPAKPPVKGGQPGKLDNVNRGYNGSQVFNTSTATATPEEPAICDRPGPVVWFAYEPPASGTLRLDTTGSQVAVALTLFTWTGALTNLGQLQPITCAAGPTAGTVSVLEAAALLGRSYVVGLTTTDALGGGTVRLNYQLDETRPPLAPTAELPTTPLEVPAGRPLQLTARAGGSPPYSFTWLKDGVIIAVTDQPELWLPAPARGDSGSYQVRVSNYFAAALSDPLPLVVLLPPRLELEWLPEQLRVSFGTVTGQDYQLELRAPDGDNRWHPWGEPVAGTGETVSLLQPRPTAGHGWLRARARPPASP